MIVTEVPLSERQSESLNAIAKTVGRSPEDLIREGIEWVIAQHAPEDWRAAIRSGAGLWRERDDLPDLRELREESSRY